MIREPWEVERPWRNVVDDTLWEIHISRAPVEDKEYVDGLGRVIDEYTEEYRRRHGRTGKAV